MFIGLLFYGVFFFVKQKTAYEMRISDWSSDVCSSDLFARHRTPRENVPPRPDPAEWPAHQPPRRQDVRLHAVEQARKAHPAFVAHQRDAVAASGKLGREGGGGNHIAAGAAGSEEDRKSTRLNSRSLMRISFAVFCLKKKNQIKRSELKIPINKS